MCFRKSETRPVVVLEWTDEGKQGFLRHKGSSKWRRTEASLPETRNHGRDGFKLRKAERATPGVLAAARLAGLGYLPGDELLGRLRAQLHLRHFLGGQVRRVLDVQVRSENWLTRITLLLIFPRLQGAFKGLFKVNTAMNCALRAKGTQINVYLDSTRMALKLLLRFS